MSNCPRCGGELKRIHRSGLERFLSKVYPMHRFRCKDPECGFEGRLAVSDRGKKRLLLLLLLVSCILVLVILKFVV